MTQEAILITGATSGIGLATARLMSESKTKKVVGLGRNLQGLLNLKAIGPNVVSLSAELTQKGYIRAIKEVIDANELTVSTLIHCAGVGLSQGFTHYNPEAVENLFKVNVYSAFELINEFLPGMLNLGKGNICLVSSTAGIYGYKYNGAYCATKHALIGMVKSLAMEHGKRGIVATAVCPGVVDTPMTQKTIAGLVKYQGLTNAQAIEKLSAISPQNRIIPAEEVAEVIAFTCSGKAPALNGSSLILGGGE